MSTSSFYRIEDLFRQRIASGRSYLEFLRVPSLSCGLYTLSAGAEDKQSPHAEDEIYYVITGSARMTIRQNDGALEDRALEPGDIIFVPARADHRFHTITQDLVVLVVFAPAETPVPTGA
ncbi:MAG TPA: cupin domain-containing protein [Candidatus Acidoferrum sp.]